MKNLAAFSIDDLPFPALKLSGNKEITAVNKQATDLLGYQFNELVDAQLTMLFADQDIFKNTIEQYSTNIVAKPIRQVTVINKAQQLISVSMQVSKKSGEFLVLIFSSSMIISDKINHRLEHSNRALVKRLKQQNSYLILAETVGNSGHWRVDLTDNSVFWSHGTYQIYGVDESYYKPTFNSTLNFYTKAEKERISQIIQSAIENKKCFYYKSTIVKANGEKVTLESTGRVELDDSGQVKSIFVVLRDISKWASVFDKLKLLALVNYTIKVPIFFINENDDIVYQDISPQHGDEKSNLFSYLNFSITEYLKFKKQAKSKGQIRRLNISFDKFASVFDVSITFESEANIYIWIVENVTDKFHLEQQQVISNRLALLGNTFGNVSHDINNVLGVALGSIEMLELKYSQGETDISRYINRVKNAVDKGKSVTERLLEFTRKPMPKIVNFDPIQEIRENKYLFQQLLLINIEIQYEIDNIGCSIHFPHGEFINILLNLVLNAQDAIQGKGASGKIVITAKVVDGNRLEIHVIDSGIGIADENLTKIFDPFYSSKSFNKGNGIGLANVYNTMYKYNGSIRVEGSSKLGGAHFILIFKCKLAPNILIANKKNKDVDVKGKRILVLDDEVSIAEFVGLYLESLGADVICVNNKDDLNKEVNAYENLDMFITDMILPDLSGMEAINIVKNKFNQVKIFSMSGYIATNSIDWQYPVLRKPFNSKELAEFLAE